MAPSEAPRLDPPAPLPLKSPSIKSAQAPPKSQLKSPRSSEEVQAGKEAAGNKPSGAELKLKAKAEKQARRERERLALEKQGLGASGGSQAIAIPKDGERLKGGGGKAGPSKASTSPVKEEGKAQKRRGSNAVEVQKTLALRAAKPAQGPLATKPSASRKDHKQVALFGHLYGYSRRTSVAGVSKDVHPAALALGLQMSSYVVCGSNARCVATLLVFKRVCHTEQAFDQWMVKLTNDRSSSRT